MSLADEGFSFGLEVMGAAEVDSANLDGGLRAGSRQAFFEGEGLIAMDLDGCLRCLSRNPILQLEVISFSCFSFSQIIGDVSQLTLALGLSLEDEEDKDDEEDEADYEDGEVGGGVLAL